MGLGIGAALFDASAPARHHLPRSGVINFAQGLARMYGAPTFDEARRNGFVPSCSSTSCRRGH
jgi:hypothetical protein